jgi:predicted RNase H-like HicB family nuclease
MSDPNTNVGPGIAAPALGGTIPIAIPIDLPARLHRDPDGALWADVPALLGCVAGGETLDEVLANLAEAAEGWLLARQDVETNGWSSS